MIILFIHVSIPPPNLDAEFLTSHMHTLTDTHAYSTQLLVLSVVQISVLSIIGINLFVLRLHVCPFIAAQSTTHSFTYTIPHHHCLFFLSALSFRVFTICVFSPF